MIDDRTDSGTLGAHSTKRTHTNVGDERRLEA